MHDLLLVYLDYDMDDAEERFCIEEEIKYLDKIVEKQGWKYSGFANAYIPIVRERREETVDKVLEAIASDERLKKYSPKVINSTVTNFCSLREIDLQHMTKPSDIKYNRYEKYYLENKKLAHGIIVDEDKKIRDGYISYLLAEKYGCKVDIIEVPKESSISKLVIGHHVKYDKEQKAYVTKTSRRYAWVYNLPEAVVPRDILLVRTSKGNAYMQVESITYIAGKRAINKYKRVKRNITAIKEID
ncbi:MAG: hypothetical protein J6A94_06015 [Lachnospiraceae bacterium]|nr:hypothetical protein [Lachnospiraceae bacterium]